MLTLGDIFPPDVDTKDQIFQDVFEDTYAAQLTRHGLFVKTCYKMKINTQRFTERLKQARER